MKIVKFDLKHKKISVIPETENDLWILEHIVTPPAVVSGKTERSIVIEQGEKRIKVRKKVYVQINVEKTEFSEYGIRVCGKIIEGPEEIPHSYHTFEIKIGEIVEIEKDWSKYEVELIKRSKSKPTPVLVCVLDEREATIGLITDNIKILAEMYGEFGKQYTSNNAKFYSEISKFLLTKPYKLVVIAGPGFAKEYLYERLKHSDKTVYMDTISHTGYPGFTELLRRGMIRKIIRDSEVVEQTQVVDMFFELIYKDGLVVYGMEEVKKAIELGAVETILVSDKMVRENSGILKSVENMGGKVKIIDSRHEAGKRFLGIGGIGAFLRFKL